MNLDRALRGVVVALAVVALVSFVAALAACGVAISGRVEVGEHVGTGTASPCPGTTE
jgi:hypothetical protein